MLYPMFFMVMLTFVILLFMLQIRLTNVRRSEVPLSYYFMFQDEEIPDLVIKTSRNIANLFEVPILFYTAGVPHVALEMSDSDPVTPAWLFVIARVIHTGHPSPLQQCHAQADCVWLG
tara:strand:- start:771 stop:1124 length:354 start_codon:yes stop_codon:yes gene_type:complete